MVKSAQKYTCLTRVSSNQLLNCENTQCTSLLIARPISHGQASEPQCVMRSAIDESSVIVARGADVCMKDHRREGDSAHSGIAMAVSVVSVRGSW
jgi:hypothetical protein